MKISPFISFAGATEDRVSHERAMPPSHLSRINMFVNDPAAAALRIPAPTAIIAAHGAPPCAFTNGPVSYQDWMTLGAHIVVVSPDGDADRIQWSQPGVPGEWASYDGSGNRTGAGYSDLNIEGTLWWCKATGPTAALFHAEGLGQLAQTGNWLLPFTYSQTNGPEHIAEAEPIVIGPLVYFFDQYGDLCFTNGADVQALNNGPFNLARASTWVSATGISTFLYDEATDCIRLACSSTTDIFYINRKNGFYTNYNSSNTYELRTGVLDLVGPDRKCHIMGVRLFLSLSAGTSTLKLQAKGLKESTWISTEAATVRSADTEMALWVNANCTDAQIRLIPTAPTGGGILRLHGMSVFYEDGGLRDP